MEDGMQTVTLGDSHLEVTRAGAVRTVAGAPFGSDKANEDVAPVQAKVVEALGLSHLEKVASQ
jgi:hypothetical protein